MIGNNRTIELAKIKYVVDKDGVAKLVNVATHRGRVLSGVATHIMKEISPILTEELNKIVNAVGGKIASTTATTAAEIQIAKETAIKSVIGKITTGAFFVFGVVIEIFANPNTAQAAEIERPIHIQLNPEDIGLTEEYFDKLFDAIILINHTDVPEPVIIRGSRYI